MSQHNTDVAGATHWPPEQTTPSYSLDLREIARVLRRNVKIIVATPIVLLILSVVFVSVVIVAVVAIVNLAVGPRTFRPSIWGKLATATYIVMVVVVMYFNWQRQESPLIDVLIVLALALTLISAGDYFLRFRTIIGDHGAAK